MFHTCLIQVDLVDDAELEALTNKIKVVTMIHWIEKCMLMNFIHVEIFSPLAAHKWDGTDEKGEVW